MKIAILEEFLKILQSQEGFIRQANPDLGSQKWGYFTNAGGNVATDVGSYGRGLYGYGAYGDSQR